jgi:hypothetical protein
VEFLPEMDEWALLRTRRSMFFGAKGNYLRVEQPQKLREAVFERSYGSFIPDLPVWR